MALFLVVHHPDDKDRPWINSWLDNDCIETIQTTAKIGGLCKEAQSSDQFVFIHRCRFGESPPVICCTARIASVDPTSAKEALVRFKDQRPMDCSPPVSPVRGQNHYDAKALAKG